MKQILSSDNLNRAYLQVVRNKGAEGVDGMKYTELKEHLVKDGEIIKEQLRTRKYKPQPVRRVEIPKPDGGVRNLGVPTVTDRFIQQAIAQVLTPIYEEQFHDHSYGFRPNRCAQQAILTALDMMNDGNDWIVDIDLEKFFDTVNHDKLMTIIGRTIKDGDVISIVRKYLVSGIMIDDEYEDSIVGTPQGGNLSPLLANIMLNELDKEMEKRGLNFVRYADDCIIMVGSEMSANRVMRNISRFIEEKLGLKVNMTKSKVDRPNGLKYLGFGFYFDSRAHQFKAKPHAKSVAKFKKRMKGLTCRSWGVSNSYKVEKLNQLSRLPHYDMCRYLRRTGKRHDNRRQSAQRGIFPCRLYGYPLFFPVQIRHTGKIHIQRPLRAERRFFLGVCTCTQRPIQSQNKSRFQSDKAANRLFCGGSLNRTAAVFFAQRQRRDKPCGYGDDCRHAPLLPACHV